MTAITVEYFAQLREQAGQSHESLDSSAATLADLYTELRQRHGFKLEAAQLKVAVNTQFHDWSRPLASGDVVVFIPPVSGG